MIDEEGGISEVIQADVTSEESCKNAVSRTVELFGAVHVLVNIGKCFTKQSFNCMVRHPVTNGVAIQSESEAPSAMLLPLTWRPGIGTFVSTSPAWCS